MNESDDYCSDIWKGNIPKKRIEEIKSKCTVVSSKQIVEIIKEYEKEIWYALSIKTQSYVKKSKKIRWCIW